MAASTWSSQELVSRIFDEICPPQMLSDISVRMVDQFIGERRKKVRPATVNRDLRTLKAAFNQARKRGYLESNPFAEVKQLKVPQKEIRVLSPDEIQRLLGACPNLQWRSLVFLALVTGIRVGRALQPALVRPGAGKRPGEGR